MKIRNILNKDITKNKLFIIIKMKQTYLIIFLLSIIFFAHSVNILNIIIK